MPDLKEAVEVLKAERGNIELIEPEDYLREQALSLAISKLSLLEQVEKGGVEKLEPTHGYEYENGYNRAIDLCNASLVKKLEGIVLLKGHIERESDFWITVHCPESGMIFDFMKKDQAIISHLTGGKG